MLKHVQISPMRGRADSLSIRSSTSCSSSLCGSPEPPHEHHQMQQSRTPSRTSSFSSLSETIPQTTLKIYTGCLRQDIEYKTLIISWDTTCKDIVGQVLRRCKMRHRDPKLFYLSMEVTIRPSAVQTTLVLEDDARPALLQACHTKGASRFSLQIKPGGLVRVHTSVLQPMAQYKSLMISEVTTCDELLTLLLSCYNLHEPVEQFSLYEVCQVQEYQRKLHPDDMPLQAQIKRKQRGEICHFLVRRNPHYPRRRQLLPSIMEKSCSNLPTTDNLINHQSVTNNLSSLSLPVTICSPTVAATTTAPTLAMVKARAASLDSCQTSTDNGNQVGNYYSDIEIDRLTTRLDALDANGHEAVTSFIVNRSNKSVKPKIGVPEVCAKCKNTFRSCEFCMKNIDNQLARQLRLDASTIAPYNPVYNVREIRTNSVSSFAVDKRSADDKANNNVLVDYRRRFAEGRGRLNSDAATIESRPINYYSEAVNSNPSNGIGNYVYI